MTTPEREIKIVVELRLPEGVTGNPLDPPASPAQPTAMLEMPELLGPSLRDAADQWLRDGSRTGVGTATAKRRKAVLKQFREHVEGVPCVGAITPGMIRTYDEQRLAHMKVSSRRQYLHILSQWLKWCVDQEWIPSNPVAKVKMPKGKQSGGSRAMSPAELSRLVRVTAEFERHRVRYADRSRALWYMVAGLTGLRSVEMKRILWKDVDLDAGELWLRAAVTKEARDAVIPLPEQVVESLRSWRQSVKAGAGDRVFSFQITSQTFRADLERAGITREDRFGRTLTMHGLRKTYASMLAAAGVPMNTAATLTRHKDVTVLAAIYTDAENVSAREQVSKLPALNGLQSSPAVDNPCVGADPTGKPLKSGCAGVDDMVSSRPLPHSHRPNNDGEDRRGGGQSVPPSRPHPTRKPDEAMPATEPTAFSDRNTPSTAYAQSVASGGVAGNSAGFSGESHPLSLADPSPDTGAVGVSPLPLAPGYDGVGVSDSGGSSGAAPGREAEGAAPSTDEQAIRALSEATSALAGYVAARTAGRDRQ